MVESCFGSSGQVLNMCTCTRYWFTIGNLPLSATDCARPCAGGRGRPDEDVPQAIEGAPVLPLQRHSSVREHSDQQEEVQQTAHHSAGGGGAAGTGGQWTWVVPSRSPHFYPYRTQANDLSFQSCAMAGWSGPPLNRLPCTRVSVALRVEHLCAEADQFISSYRDRKTRVDGAHQQVHWGSAAQEWEEAGGEPRCRVGAGQRGQRVHALQKDTVYDARAEGR